MKFLTKYRESILFFYINSWRIAARITKMGQIELSKTTLIKLMHHLKSVPLLYSNMMATLHRINLYCKSSFYSFMIIKFSMLFLVTIFPPDTTVEVDLSVQRCFLLFNQSRTSIKTGKLFFFSLIDYFCLIFKTFIVIYRKQGMKITMKRILQFY